MVHPNILLLSTFLVSPIRSCPEGSQWQLRAKAYCKEDYRTYQCFVSLNTQVNDIPEYLEDCNGSILTTAGFIPGFYEWPDKKLCSEYQNPLYYSDPVPNSDCINSRSYCNEEGQIVVNEGNATEDLMCFCDFTQGYAFLFKPQYRCYCKPSYEDCTCYNKLCSENMVLSPDYHCIKNNVSTNFQCLFYKQIKIEEIKVETTPFTDVVQIDKVYLLTIRFLLVTVILTTFFAITGIIMITEIIMIEEWRHEIQKQEEVYAPVPTTKYICDDSAHLIDGCINDLEQREDKVEARKQEILYSTNIANRVISQNYPVNLKTTKTKYSQILKLPIFENEAARNVDVKSRKFSLGEPIEDANERTLMIVGATGSGKSTLINAMANHILGVRWTDNYRYALIDLESDEISKINDQTISQTEWITCYTLHKGYQTNLDYTINIIDTPGFGDTRGIIHDKMLMDRIYSLFKETGERGITFLDAVCFVIPAPLLRLTTTEKYILDSVLALFSNDIKDNFCSLITFSDGYSPPVVKSLRTVKEIPLLSLQYFTFNCGGIFTKGDNDIERFYWDMGSKSCELLLRYVNTLATKSLILSSEVLNCRKQFHEHARKLKKLADVSLQEIKKLHSELREYKPENKHIQQSSNEVKKINLIKNNDQTIKVIFEKIQSIKKNLQNIALRPDIEVDQYIDLLIASEENERKQGFENRIVSLNEYKKQQNYNHVVEEFNDCISSIFHLIDNCYDECLLSN